MSLYLYIVYPELDMVELMLMQNAQMHQIIMHNMMLKTMPPTSLMPPAGPSYGATNTAYLGQVLRFHKFMDKAHSLI